MPRGGISILLSATRSLKAKVIGPSAFFVIVKQFLQFPIRPIKTTIRRIETTIRGIAICFPWIAIVIPGKQYSFARISSFSEKIALKKEGIYIHFKLLTSWSYRHVAFYGPVHCHSPYSPPACAGPDRTVSLVKKS